MALYDDLINDSNQKLEELKELVDNLLGGNMASQEEIKNAIIQALEESASRFLSGQGGNVLGGVTIDADGNISITPPGIIPDDPATTADNEARAGAVMSIRKGFNLIWADLSTYFVQNPSDSAQAKFRIKSKYKVDASLMDAAITLYWANRNASIAVVSSFASSLDSRLYCKGQSKQTINTWIIDTVTAAAQEQAIGLVNAVSDEQIQEWQRQGQAVGSSDYVTYACVPVDNDSWSFVNPNTTSTVINGTVAQKINHRILFEASGKVMNPNGDGSYIDLLYNVDVNGVATLAPASGTALFNFGGIFTRPTAAEVPFEPSGIYRFTRDTQNSGIPGIHRRSAWTGTNGSISLTLKDLGEIPG